MPSAADEDVLELLFESNRKGGGGPVKHVQLNREKKWAIIEFCEPDAVKAVMSKLPITLMGIELEIHPYTPLVPGGVVIQSLDIRGLPKDLTDDLLTKDVEGIIGTNEVSSAEYESDNDANEMNEQSMGNVVKDLKPVQLRMLRAIQYPNSISETFPNVKVKINLEKNEVLFSGERAGIEFVKLNFFAKLSSFSVCMLDDIPTDVLEFYQSERVVAYINKKLSAAKVVCAWEVRTQYLIVCSLHSDITRCSNIIRESVKTEKFPISNESAVISLSSLWQDQLKEVRKDNDLTCKIISNRKETYVHLILTDDRAQDTTKGISTKIKDFLKRNSKLQTVYVTTNELGPNFSALYNVSSSLVQKELKSIAEDLSVHSVTIVTLIVTNSAVEIKGTLEGRELAKQRIIKLF